MATTKGPAFAMGAGGSILRTMVFSNWKGRPYVKYSGPVRNPNTAPQVVNQAMLRFLARNFATLSAEDIATWLPLALQNNITTYNAWIQTNLDRWARYLFPSKAYPATEETDAYGPDSASAAALNRSIVLNWARSEWEDDWGYVIFRSTTVFFTPKQPDVIRIGLWGDAQGSTMTYTDGPLTPDTWFYKMGSFSATGKLNPNFTSQVSATIS